MQLSALPPAEQQQQQHSSLLHTCHTGRGRPCRPCSSSAPQRCRVLAAAQASQRAPARQRLTQATYPVPETEKERSPIDFPQEWITPQPSRRPDTQPEFERLETPLPKKLPGDPEVPDEEEEEEEEKKKKKDPDEDNPDDPNPEEPAPGDE